MTNHAERHSHEDDSFILPLDYLDTLRVKTEERVEPFYFQNQEYMADVIIERITSILQIYHSKSLNDFKSFEFQIYTAKFEMLEIQTRNRLCHAEAGCFDYKTFISDKESIQKNGSTRVKKYVLSDDVKKRHSALLQEAADHPDKLILIVADEAHWGSVTLKQRDGANPTLINEWNTKSHPNVIVLQVTATPYNLMTDNSRIPVRELYAKCVLQHENKILAPLIVENTKVYHNGTDVTNDIGPLKNLHCIKWSECFQASIQNKSKLILKLPNKDGVEFSWLKLVMKQNVYGLYKLTKTAHRENSPTFEMQGLGKHVQITTIQNGKKLILGILRIPYRRKHRYSVGFVSEDDRPNMNVPFCTDFEIISEYGQDIIQIRSSLSILTPRLLMTNDGYISLERHRSVDGLHKAPTMASCFIIDSLRAKDEIQPTRQYASLNMYYNSMRETVRSKQLIRGDPLMVRTYQQLKVKPHDVLIADYCYYILNMGAIRKFIETMQGLKDTYNDCVITQIQKAYNIYKNQRFSLLRRFKKRLEDDHKDELNTKPISSDIFAKVVQNFENALQSCSSDEPTDIHLMLHIHGTCGQYENKTDCAKALYNMENYYTILEDISETFKVVNELIPFDPHQELNGQMKIIRVTCANHGSKLYNSLCLARAVATGNDSYIFEIVRDYDRYRIGDIQQNADDHSKRTSDFRIQRLLQPDNCQHEDSRSLERCPCCHYEVHPDNIQCKSCKHIHKYITEYKDLNKMPCILILNNKGTMGDTFPDSLSVMDLRLNFLGVEKTIYITTLAQWLGRMCRYTKRSDHKHPYALVGPTLYGILQRALKKTSIFYGVTDGKRLDRKMTKKLMEKKGNRGSQSQNILYLPSKNNIDFGNNETHKNRLLLQAEPQIGKTGAYLNVISKLRKVIESAPEDVNGEIDLESESECSDNETTPVEDSYLQWDYPHWKLMQNGKVLPTRLNSSKYNRLFGPYEYGNVPKVLMKIPVRGDKKKGEPSESTTYSFESKIKYKAYTALEHSCLSCKKNTESVTFKISVELHNSQSVDDVEITIPQSRKFKPVFDILKTRDNSEETQKQTTHLSTLLCETDTDDDAPLLSTWIFMPTYQRALDGNINLTHTMVHKGIHADYVHILVVRHEDCFIYRQNFQSTHAILVLPNSLPDIDVGVSEGGIGYARYFTQMFAETYYLRTIFFMDDNLSNVYDLLKAKKPNSSDNCESTRGGLAVECTSMYKVLKHMETIFECGDKTQDPAFEPCPYNLNCCCCDPACKRHCYTGPISKYALMGMMKRRNNMRQISKPFSKAHVCSLVLLNIDALKTHNIHYLPYYVAEDLTLNNSADKNGLWVCKYNRFIIQKRQLKTWLPRHFIWSDDVDLKTCIGKPRPPYFTVSKHLLQWLKQYAPPKRTEILQEENGNSQEYLHTLTLEIKQLLPGRHLFIFAPGHLSSVTDLRNKLDTFFQKTEGAGGFVKHVLLFTTKDCMDIGLTNTASFHKLLSPLFTDVSVSVITSHNVHKHDVPVLFALAEGHGMY